MVSPIIISKIILPQSNPFQIRRDRLFERLDASVNNRLVIVCAPAGYGKTSLLREWLCEKDDPITWFSIEPNDNDIVQFLTYLLSALQSAFPESFQNLINAIGEIEETPSERVLSVLINELTPLNKRIRIVLDDYHFIDNDKIHELMIFLIEHLPKTAQVIITTRIAPPFPLHRWRARNQLSEINFHDLKFNYSETVEFLINVMGLSLTPDELQTVNTRTEGWASAIQLVALATKSHTNLENHRTDFLESFSIDHHFILDYLNKEVISQQPPNIRLFLLRTSILDRLSASLCDHLFEIDNSTEIIDFLVDHNLFIVPLDDARQWYRYHSLFSELLQNMLHQERQSEMPKLHLRARDWYAQNQFYYRAISHALASGDPSEAIPVAEDFILDLFAKGKPETCRQWISLIPVEVIRSRPLLCLAQASATSVTHPFDYDLIEAWALQAIEVDPVLLDSAISHTNIPYNSVRDFVNAQIAWLNTSLARVRAKSPKYIIQKAETALSLTDRNDFFIASSLWMSISRAYMNLGEPKEAEQAIQKALSLSEMSGNATKIVDSLWTQAYLAYWQGNFQKALRIYQDVEEKYIFPAISNGVHLSPSSSIYTFHASVLRELNQLDAAKQYFIKSQNLIQLRDLSDISLDNQIGLTWIDVYQGNSSCIKELENIISQLPPKKEKMVAIHINRMRLFLREHHPDLVNKAFHWLDVQRSGWKPMQRLEDAYLLWIWALLLRKHQGNTVPDLSLEHEHLEIQYQLAEKAHYRRSQVWIRLLQSLVYQELEDFESANRLFFDTLFLAEPEGYVRTIIDAGKLVIPLLNSAISNKITPFYAKSLLHNLMTAPDSPANEGKVIPTIKPLTPREKEVLILVAEGLSNQQIAERLVLSQGTIKKYLSSVYQKLYVHRRTQAIARAKELQIL